jgi:tetratricopeptide (TPR) repeat protein
MTKHFKLKLYFVLLCLMACQHLVAQNVVVDTSLAKKYFNEGEGFYVADKYDEAILSFSKAIRIDSSKYNYYMMRADAEKLLKKYDVAEKDIQRAITLNHDDDKLFSIKASIEFNTQRYDLSIEDYTKAISINPKAKYYAGRCYSYKKLNRYEDALKDNEVVIQKLPKKVGLHMERGELYYYCQKYDLAISEMNKYIELGGKEQLQAVYYILGLSHIQKEQYKKAISELEFTIKIDPKEIAYNYLGQAYRAIGDTVNALKCFEVSIKSDTCDVVNYKDYGVTEYYYGNCPKALELFTRYYKRLKPKDSFNDFYKYIGLIYACNGDTAIAFDDFQKGLKINENNIGIYQSRLRLFLLKDGYSDQNIEDVNKIIELNTDTIAQSYLYGLRGFLKAYSNDSLGAEIDYKKAVDIAKDEESKAISYYNFACYYGFFRNMPDHLKEVEMYLNKSINSDRKILDSYKLLAIIYVGNGKKAKAKKILKEAESACVDSPRMMEIRELKKIIDKGLENTKDNSSLKMVSYLSGSTKTMNFIMEGSKIRTWPNVIAPSYYRK